DREAADRPAVNDVIERAARCALALALEQPIVVAVVRGGTALLLVALAGCLRDERAKWTGRLARLRRPVQAVVLPRAARKLLPVVEHAVAVAILRRVFQLRVDDRFQHLDRVELVCADPAREQLLLARFGIEAPALAAFHDRKRKRIVVVADG